MITITLKKDAEKPTLGNQKYSVNKNNPKIVTFTEKCRDEVIGVLEIYKLENTEFCLRFKRRDDYETLFVGIEDHDAYFESISQEISGKVAIVLESPHKKEHEISNVKDFASKSLVNARPANGTTGKNIDEFTTMDQEFINNILESIYPDLKNVASKTVLSFSIINAIQYQCSLGVDTKKFRDNAFRELWKKQTIQKDFKQQINKLFPDFIINAVTKGYGPKSMPTLKNLVTQTLETNQTPQNATTDHPSSWGTKNIESST